jgi:hypothetical protein
VRPPDDRVAARQARIAEAEHALARGRFNDARRLMGEARGLGAKGVKDPRLTQLQKAIKEAEAGQAKRARVGPWAGLGVGLLAYLLVSAAQPPAWGIPVWALLAFVVVPGIIGYTTGRVLGRSAERKPRFRAGLFAGAAAMFLYASVTLMVLHARIGSTGDSGEVFLVGLFVSLVYSGLAGAVAGAASAYLAWSRAEGDSA